LDWKFRIIKMKGLRMKLFNLKINRQLLLVLQVIHLNQDEIIRNLKSAIRNRN
jgi:hypothetical protein